MNCDEYIRLLKLEEISQNSFELKVYVMLVRAAFEAGYDAGQNAAELSAIETSNRAQLPDDENFDQDPR